MYIREMKDYCWLRVKPHSLLQRSEFLDSPILLICTEYYANIMLPRLVYEFSSSWDRIHLQAWLQLVEWMHCRVLLKLELYSPPPLLLVVDVMIDPMTLMM